MLEEDDRLALGWRRDLGVRDALNGKHKAVGGSDKVLLHRVAIVLDWRGRRRSKTSSTT